MLSEADLGGELKLPHSTPRKFGEFLYAILWLHTRLYAAE
jgi:hypothetical protein